MRKKEMIDCEPEKSVGVFGYNEPDRKQLVEAIKEFEKGKEQPVGRFRIVERLN